MKQVKAHKISGGILGICLLVVLAIFSFFYIAYVKDPESISAGQTDGILICSFCMFFISCFSVLFFSVYHLIKGGKSYFQKISHSLLSLFMLGMLFLVTYQLGSGEPLTIVGYQGNENTYHWLKISDMWIYSCSILLVLIILAIITGIIWDIFKKK